MTIRRKAFCIRAAIAILALGCLDAACRLGWISSLTVVAPSLAAMGLVKLLLAGTLNTDLLETGREILAATVSSVVGGALLGVVLHALPRVRRVVDPLLATYYFVPIFVFYPLLIVFFGLNDISKVAIGFLLGVVAMTTNTLVGLDRVPRVMWKVAAVHRLSPIATVSRVVLPAAMPSLVTGVKFAVAYAFVGILGAEFILSSSGIGYQIAFAFNNFDNLTMYALILLLLIVVAVVNGVITAMERRVLQRRGIQ